MSYFANYIPERSCLVVIVRKGQVCDLAPLLKRYDVREIGITGTPINVAAISEYPQIEVVDVDRYERPDLNDFCGLTKLMSLEAAFGHLANIELDFCSDTLEYLRFFKLSRLKDLSRLTRTCMPRLKTLIIDSIRNYVPPDFQMFPNLLDLTIKNTNWASLKCLPKVTTLEYLSIWGNKIADNDWRPLVELPHLKTLHGMQTVFRSADREEFARIRPDVELYQRALFPFRCCCSKITRVGPPPGDLGRILGRVSKPPLARSEADSGHKRIDVDLVFYEIDPEVPGGWGEDTIADTSTHPAKVSKLHFEFEGWLGDDLVQSFPCYLVTERLAESQPESGVNPLDLQAVMRHRAFATTQTFYLEHQVEEQACRIAEKVGTQSWHTEEQAAKAEST